MNIELTQEEIDAIQALRVKKAKDAEIAASNALSIQEKLHLKFQEVTVKNNKLRDDLKSQIKMLDPLVIIREIYTDFNIKYGGNQHSAAANGYLIQRCSLINISYAESDANIEIQLPHYPGEYWGSSDKKSYFIDSSWEIESRIYNSDKADKCANIAVNRLKTVKNKRDAKNKVANDIIKIKKYFTKKYPQAVDISVYESNYSGYDYKVYNFPNTGREYIGVKGVANIKDDSTITFTTYVKDAPEYRSTDPDMTSKNNRMVTLFEQFKKDTNDLRKVYEATCLEIILEGEVNND